jgi:hypothetical protein
MAGLIGGLAVLATIAIIIKLTLDHRMRQKLVDKGMVDENVKFLYASNGGARTLPSLKWALVLMGIGLAILVGQIVPGHMTEEITFSCMFLFAGLGLLVYYAVASKKLKQ